MGTQLTPAQKEVVANIEDILGVITVAIEGYPYRLLDLASAAGVCTSTVSRFLNRKVKSPHLKTVVSLLLALGFKVEIRKLKQVGLGRRGTLFIKAA